MNAKTEEKVAERMRLRKLQEENRWADFRAGRGPMPVDPPPPASGADRAVNTALGVAALAYWGSAISFALFLLFCLAMAVIPH